MSEAWAQDLRRVLVEAGRHVVWQVQHEARRPVDAFCIVVDSGSCWFAWDEAPVGWQHGRSPPAAGRTRPVGLHRADSGPAGRAARTRSSTWATRTRHGTRRRSSTGSATTPRSSSTRGWRPRPPRPWPSSARTSPGSTGRRASSPTSPGSTVGGPRRRCVARSVRSWSRGASRGSSTPTGGTSSSASCRPRGAPGAWWHGSSTPTRPRWTRGWTSSSCAAIDRELRGNGSSAVTPVMDAVDLHGRQPQFTAPGSDERVHLGRWTRAHRLTAHLLLQVVPRLWSVRQPEVEERLVVLGTWLHDHPEWGPGPDHDVLGLNESLVARCPARAVACALPRRGRVPRDQRGPQRRGVRVHDLRPRPGLTAPRYVGGTSTIAPVQIA